VVLVLEEILLALKDHPEVDIRASSRVQHHWQSLAVEVEHLQVIVIKELPAVAVARIKAVQHRQVHQWVDVQEQLLQAEQKQLVVQLMVRNTQAEMVVVRVLKAVAVAVRVITAVAVEIQMELQTVVVVVDLVI
jgi:hypothetical protein